MAEKELCMKFPCVLRKVLEDKVVSFDADTEFKYEPFLGYRVVFRKDENDFSPISENDFRSQVELGRIRGLDLSDIGAYSVSFNLDRLNLEFAFKFSLHPERKIIKGNIFQEGGPRRIDNKTQHVDWWIYEGADLSGFSYAN